MLGPLLLLVLALLLPFHLLGTALDAGSDIALHFLRAPPAFSASPLAAFRFEIVKKANFSVISCSDCRFTCKLDHYNYTNCESRETSYASLSDGHHTLEVCIKWSEGTHCESYAWVVDTISPTAYVAAATSFTNSSNVSVHIIFSEPCTGGGGFRCSLNYCNLLVYGAGQVIPSTLKVLRPDIEYSLVIGVSNSELYGRLVLVMDKGFCTDLAGNKFIRTSNSIFVLHFDRRDVVVNLRTHIPERLVQLNGEMRIVEATNNAKNLRIYLYFSEPVLNSSTEILGVLHASSGSIFPTNNSSIGNLRFRYVVRDIPRIAIVTVTCETSSIISRQGTPVSPADPVTFLYDAQRPSVMVRTTSNMRRTRKHNIPVLVKFAKPVLDFNSSAVQLFGGRLLSFSELSKSMYTIQIHAEDRVISVEVPENVTADLAGNRNLASNRLVVTKYSVPMISSLVSDTTTVIFLVTSICAALLNLATANLISFGGFSRTTTYLISEPSRNLLRTAYHIQIFALSKWLAVDLPIEYYEFAMGIQWIIPHIRLPWETVEDDAFIENRDFYVGTDSDIFDRRQFITERPLGLNNMVETNMSISGAPLTPLEYRSFIENGDMKPEAEFMMFLEHQTSWKLFSRNMFWLAIIGGGLFLLHVIIRLTLKLKRNKSDKQKDYGALVMPRFEIFLMFLALPCLCQASAIIIKGRCAGGIIVGSLLLGIALSLVLSLIWFLSIGITMGKLLQYKEVHQVGQAFHWYQEIIRVCLGPGKRGQWTWMEDDSNSVRLTQLGPMFEDLRGPPKYMLSQISGSRNNGKLPPNRIIASDDETEDAEAPFIQKLFGILRIYYTLLECMKRASLGILAGMYSSGNHSGVPKLFALCFTSFQLFFLMLKKPFIKKKVQLVELISVTSELLVFVACFVHFEKDLSEEAESRVGFMMLVLFIICFAAQMINEWYALYKQVLRLSPGKDSFCSGLKTTLIGLMLIVLPGNQQLSVSTQVDGETAANTDTSPGGNVQRSEKPWLRQLRELAKASFSREREDGAASMNNDPSSSKNQRRFWMGKRSGSSSVTSSSSDNKAKGEFKSRSRGLYKDLETIFSSK